MCYLDDAGRIVEERPIRHIFGEVPGRLLERDYDTILNPHWFGMAVFGTVHPELRPEL